MRIAAFLFNLLFLTTAHAAVTETKIHRVLLVVAMDEEAKPLVKTLNLQKMEPSFSKLPIQSYKGKYAGLDVFLVTNGKDPKLKISNVGTQPATLTTYLGIDKFHPDLVINIGTAGGLIPKGAKVGDIYVSQKIYFYHRRISLPTYREYGLGGYVSVNTTLMASRLGLKEGVVCSGDSFDDNQTDYQMLQKENCDVKEMEAAGVAWVSSLTNTPMFAIKGVTDHIESKSGPAQFQKNLTSVSQKLAEKLQLVLQYFADKSMEQL